MGLCRKDHLLTKFFEKKGNKTMRDKIREWLDFLADDCDIVAIWNGYADYSQKMLYCMDDINEVLSNNTVQINYEIISDAYDNGFSFSDGYFSYDSSEDEIRSCDKAYDLLTIDDENNLVSYILEHRDNYKGYADLYDILNPYGFKSDHDGLYYQTEKRKYNLYEGKTIKGDTEKTSDIIFIMDDENAEKDAKIVNFIYGATMITDELKQMIAKMIKEYEEREGKNL